MLLVCGRNCFYVIDKVGDFTEVLTAGSKKIDDVQALVYKTYKYVLDNIDNLLKEDFVNKFIELGISIYKLGEPKIYVNPARCETYGEQLFEYINLKFKLFGYVYVTPKDALSLTM